MMVHQIEWDNHTKKISYQCMFASNSAGTHSPSTAVGLSIASDKPTPIIRGEIRFPSLSGYIKGHFYAAQEVKAVIDVEPKAPPVAKRHESRSRDLIYRENSPAPAQPSNLSSAWRLIGDGAMILTITILTDFIFGIGIADDAVTIPLGLSLVGTGMARLMFPVVVRQTSLYVTHRMAYVGAGMMLKAAH